MFFEIVNSFVLGGIKPHGSSKATSDPEGVPVALGDPERTSERIHELQHF